MSNRVGIQDEYGNITWTTDEDIWADKNQEPDYYNDEKDKGTSVYEIRRMRGVSAAWKNKSGSITVVMDDRLTFPNIQTWNGTIVTNEGLWYVAQDKGIRQILRQYKEGEY